eukprot:COSAG01_NODE_858_length_13069_cov_23.641943_12_plen_137_part_00
MHDKNRRYNGWKRSYGNLSRSCSDTHRYLAGAQTRERRTLAEWRTPSSMAAVLRSAISLSYQTLRPCWRSSRHSVLTWSPAAACPCDRKKSQCPGSLSGAAVAPAAAPPLPAAGAGAGRAGQEAVPCGRPQMRAAY